MATTTSRPSSMCGGRTARAGRVGAGGQTPALHAHLATHKMVSGSEITWCAQKPRVAESFDKYLSTSLSARQLTNGGPLQRVLETRLSELTKSQRRIVPAASGTAAQHALCAAWSLNCGKTLRWATKAFTFPSAMQGMQRHGAVVVDSDWALGGPSLSKLSERSNEFDGVVVTNVFGMLTNMVPYVQWCKDKSKLLIFDNAATGVGVIPGLGTCIHDVGDGAFISLHETQPLGRGEGGAVFVDAGMHDYVVRAMNFGFSSVGAPGVCRVGDRACSNWRLSDIAAAAVLAYIDRVIDHGFVDKVNDLVSYGVSVMASYSNLTLIPGLQFPNPSMPPCLCITLPETIDIQSLITILASKERPIEAKQYYRPLCDSAEAPNAWSVFNSCICLPIHVDMDRADVEYMVKSVAYEVNDVHTV